LGDHLLDARLQRPLKVRVEIKVFYRNRHEGILLD
jgi:hypothetical protein